MTPIWGLLKVKVAAATFVSLAGALSIVVSRTTLAVQYRMAVASPSVTPGWPAVAPLEGNSVRALELVVPPRPPLAETAAGVPPDTAM